MSDSHHHHHHHHHHNHQSYDVTKALNAFKSSIKNDGVTIDLQKFIIAYKELVKFFDHLGKIFTFVVADLVDKFQNIEKCISNDINKVSYTTVNSAIEYEKNKDIYMINHNTTLSLLRLIRGLDFIRKLLDNLYHNQETNKKTHELAVQAYDQTLAFRHKWAVRQLVKAGLHLLPKKQDLFQIMLNGADPNNDRKENDKLFNEFLTIINKVYSIIHKVYDENDFLELVLA